MQLCRTILSSGTFIRQPRLPSTRRYYRVLLCQLLALPRLPVHLPCLRSTTATPVRADLLRRSTFLHLVGRSPAPLPGWRPLRTQEALLRARVPRRLFACAIYRHCFVLAWRKTLPGFMPYATCGRSSIRHNVTTTLRFARLHTHYLHAFVVRRSTHVTKTLHFAGLPLPATFPLMLTLLIGCNTPYACRSATPGLHTGAHPAAPTTHRSFAFSI